MDIQLITAGVIAIPLKQQIQFGSLQPNYIVFEEQFGIEKKNSINLFTNEYELKIQECVNLKYKIVQREILEPTDIMQEEYIERIYIPTERIYLPVSALNIVVSHQQIKDNLDLVNRALSNFSFRGSLNLFKLEVDEEVLDQIIMQENEELNTGNSSNNPTDNPITN